MDSTLFRLAWSIRFIPFSSESLGNLYGIDDMGSTTFFE